MPIQRWTLVAHDADGDYSITEGPDRAVTRDELVREFTTGTTISGNRVVGLFRSHVEAVRAFPRLNKPPQAKRTA